MAPRVCAMIRSANEVMVLAAKAARGAGAPPAQAVQFGAAAIVHFRAGREVDELIQALASLPQGPILALPLAIARIAENAQTAGPLPQSDALLTQSYVEALAYAAHLDGNGVLHLDLTKPAPRVQLARIDLPDEVYAAWSDLAAVLLVPESDASRLSGAGAGLSDND